MMGSKPKGISASRGAAILGLSEYQTPLEVFQKIMEEREPGWNARGGYVMPPEPDNAAIRWGTAFESAVIELAERAVGKRIKYREEFFTSGFDGSPRKEGDAPLTCHVDGVYLDDKGGISDTLHEGKTTSAFTYREKWGEPGTDRIPRTHQIQVQHQMLCTGAEEAVVSILVFPETPDAWEKMGWVVKDENLLQNENKKCHLSYGLAEIKIWAWTLCEMGYFHQYPCAAKLNAQQMMVEKYREFWEKHVLTGIPPEPRNYEDIKRLFPEPVGTIVCDEELESWWLEYGSIREEIGKGGQLARRQEELKLLILDKARRIDAVMDEESREKTVFKNASGKKLGQYGKSGFR
jgi:hypothetical protein